MGPVGQSLVRWARPALHRDERLRAGPETHVDGVAGLPLETWTGPFLPRSRVGA